jgi:hypothetical protein
LVTISGGGGRGLRVEEVLPAGGGRRISWEGLEKRASRCAAWEEVGERARRFFGGGARVVWEEDILVCGELAVSAQMVVGLWFKWQVGRAVVLGGVMYGGDVGLSCDRDGGGVDAGLVSAAG